MNPIDAVRLHGTCAAAARALGIVERTFLDRYKKALAAAGIDDIRNFDRARKVPLTEPLPSPTDGISPELPIDELLDQASKRFRQRHAYESATSDWPVVDVPNNLPIGVLWFGDPHLGDNGCNIDLLRQHTQLCVETEGLYGANIGDTTNNWQTAGRLAKLWADQDTSISTERRLAKWLMTESGVEWLVWIIGNHDSWNHGDSLLRAINIKGIFMKNWEAKFRVAFPNGVEIKIHTAHNFKGFSDWNPMHGPLKASIKSSDADLYVAGHIHTPGSMQINLQGSKRFPLLLRVSSYKRFDHHALVHGFDDHDVGSAVLTIFNPNTRDRSGRITHFFDVEMGARVLTVMRQEAIADGYASHTFEDPGSEDKASDTVSPMKRSRSAPCSPRSQKRRKSSR